MSSQQIQLPKIQVERVKASQIVAKELKTHYELRDKLGQGTYGNVYKAYALDDLESKPYALKQFNLAQENHEKEGFPITSIREMKLLQKLDHENILKIVEVVVEQDKKIFDPILQIKHSNLQTYLVFHYCDFDFQKLLNEAATQFNESHIKCIIQQVLRGLAYIHQNNIVHRDIKSANILLDSEGFLKIGDFGLARIIQKPLARALTQIVVTLYYRAPEILLTKGIYDQKSDIWSVGCFMAELLLGTQMMKGKNQSDKGQVEAIFEICGTPTEETWPGVTNMEFWNDLKPETEYDVDQKQKLAEILGDKLSDEGIDFLSSLLTLNPYSRVSAEEALQSDYFVCEPLPCDQKELYKMTKERHDLYVNSRKKMNAQDHYPVNQIQISNQKKNYGFSLNKRRPYENIVDPTKKLKQ